MQQTAANKAFTPPNVSSREFKRDKPPPTDDYREKLFELEKAGELEVQRVPEPYVELETKYGRIKKIPHQMTWHHKSCGQCGHIPGYSTAIFWINRKLGFEYHDPRDQTSCTAWNYYASSTSNSAAQAGIAVRNFSQASEWVHAMRDRIAELQVLDLSNVTVTVHPACHYHKLVVEDAVYDRDLFDGQRTAIISGLVDALGARVGDYSTWHDCCGFGFRHILVSRDFSRSFATTRKIERMKEEVNPDVTLTHDTGCVTTLDKSQFAAQAHKRNVGIPVMSDAQFAALAMGAHPYIVCQLHWHGVDMKPLLEKMGIDHKKAWAEFEVQAERIKSGEIEYISWEEADA